MFGYWKVLKKEKTIKKNYFLIFGCIVKNIKENQSNIIKISKKNLFIFKLFDL